MAGGDDFEAGSGRGDGRAERYELAFGVVNNPRKCWQLGEEGLTEFVDSGGRALGLEKNAAFVIAAETGEAGAPGDSGDEGPESDALDHALEAPAAADMGGVRLR